MISTVIVGAGPAGMRAAETLVRNGVHPVVIDEAPQAGGQIYRRQPPGFQRTSRELYGFDAPKAEALHTAFDRLISTLDYRPNTLAWNIQNGVLFTVANGAVGTVEFDALILATGATDRMYPVPGWTTPGTYTLGGAQIALKHQGCAIGDPVVFLGSSPLLYLVAWQYAKAGANVAAVLDTTPFRSKIAATAGMLAGGTNLAKGLYYMMALRRRGITIHHGIIPQAIEGTGQVTAVRYRTTKGDERSIACSAVALGYGIKPEAQLAEIAGCRFRYAPTFRQWLPECDPLGRAAPGLYLAGDGARIGGADAAEASGRLAALALLTDIGAPGIDPQSIRTLRRQLARTERFQASQAAAFKTPLEQLSALPDSTIVCRCEHITAAEIRRVVKQPLGPNELNRVKALSRVGMGRCQGRFCGLTAAEIIAATRNTDLATAGRLRAAGPVKPLLFAAAENEPTP